MRYVAWGSCQAILKVHTLFSGRWKLMNESDFPQVVDTTSYKNPSTERTHPSSCRGRGKQISRVFVALMASLFSATSNFLPVSSPFLSDELDLLFPWHYLSFTKSRTCMYTSWNDVSSQLNDSRFVYWPEQQQYSQASFSQFHLDRA